MQRPTNYEHSIKAIQKRQTIDAIYTGFSQLGAFSLMLLAALIVSYYSLNELGDKRFNGLIRTLVPIAVIEFVISIGVVNFIDFSDRRRE
jgi:hypothetical protein